jgi:hypothetical protein
MYRRRIMEVRHSFLGRYDCSIIKIKPIIAKSPQQVGKKSENARSLLLQTLPISYNTLSHPPSQQQTTEDANDAVMMCEQRKTRLVKPKMLTRTCRGMIVYKRQGNTKQALKFCGQTHPHHHRQACSQNHQSKLIQLKKENFQTPRSSSSLINEKKLQRNDPSAVVSYATIFDTSDNRHYFVS